MGLRAKITGSLNWVGSRFSPGGAIMLYHRVAADPIDPFNLCVRPEHFDQQMQALARRGGALSLERFVATWRSGNLAPGSVSVTFDDGYLDVFDTALPILEKYEIPATIYVVSGALGTSFWWDRLAHLVFGAAELPPSLPVPGGMVETAGQSRDRVMDRLYPLFRSQLPESRTAALEILAADLDPEGKIQTPEVVSADALKEYARHPLITIGAHTVTHSRLSVLSEAGQCEEIDDSVRILSEVIDQEVKTFSYPFGLRGRDFDGKTIEAVRATGIDHALAADLNVVTARSDAFALPRLWVHDRPGRSFERQLNNWLGRQ